MSTTFERHVSSRQWSSCEAPPPYSLTTSQQHRSGDHLISTNWPLSDIDHPHNIQTKAALLSLSTERYAGDQDCHGHLSRNSHLARKAWTPETSHMGAEGRGGQMTPTASHKVSHLPDRGHRWLLGAEQTCLLHSEFQTPCMCEHTRDCFRFLLPSKEDKNTFLG